MVYAIKIKIGWLCSIGCSIPNETRKARRKFIWLQLKMITVSEIIAVGFLYNVIELLLGLDVSDLT